MIILTFLWTTVEASDKGMLREDRIWEYFSYEYKENHTECVLERYGFDWREEINGKIYKRCILLDRTSWNTPEGEMDSFHKAVDIHTETVGKCVALLREEDSRVYMIFDSDAESLHYSPAPYNNIGSHFPSPYEEKLLFDFGVGKGAVIDCFMNSYENSWMQTQAEVIEVEDVTQGAISGRKLKLSNVSGTNWNDELTIYIKSEWLEGVGNIGDGSMFLFGGVQWPLPDCYCGHGGYFNNLYDRDGNVVYKGADIRVETVGVKTVLSESESEIGHIYDLIGGRVDSPQPGTVYVRDGRKFVGR